MKGVLPWIGIISAITCVAHPLAAYSTTTSDGPVVQSAPLPPWWTHMSMTASTAESMPLGDGSSTIDRYLGSGLNTAAAQLSSTLSQCLLNNGLAYGPFRDGQGPSDPAHPSAPFATREQISEDLDFIASISRHIRIYGTSDKYAQIAQLAKQKHLDVMEGIYLRRIKTVSDQKANDAEIELAVELAQRGVIGSLIVGNESLGVSGQPDTDSTLTKEELVSYIRDVRRRLGPSNRVPISTAQVYNVWESNLDLVKEVDFVLVHIYPFWDHVPIGEAAAALTAHYRALKSDIKDKYGRDVSVVIGETGWPSGGAPRGQAVPSPENQRRFLEEFTSWACKDAVPFYYFDVFDEEWKWREGADSWEGTTDLPPKSRTFSGNWIGSSWGIYQSNGKLKPQFNGLLPRDGPMSRTTRDIFVTDSGLLSAYYDIGVDSSEHRSDWLSTDNGELEMSYPSDQKWGAVFLTVGKPTPPPRPWKDFSEFTALSLELRGEKGGEDVAIGIQNRTSPSMGTEKTVTERLSTTYQRYRIPLTDFRSHQLRVPEGLQQLYVAVEFIFKGPEGQTVYARNIRYEP